MVEERWDSMGHLAASVASRGVAPTHAHLHAINNRRKVMKDEPKNLNEENDNTEKVMVGICIIIEVILVREA